jgi:molybdopterin-containing oxidoreductase family iron-sulfur binding subunit
VGPGAEGAEAPVDFEVEPTRAIVFGNLNIPDSAVVRAKSDPRNYALLAELNTRPRTTYLARLRNPNPRLEEPAHDGDHAS